MTFRDALRLARKSVLERDRGGSRKLVFEWDLEIPWDAARGVAAGDGWRVSIVVDGKTIAVYKGESGIAALNELNAARRGPE